MTPFADYEEYDATALAELVSQRRVSPRELAEAALLRIRERNAALNAVVHLPDDATLQASVESTPDGPFHGVPFLVKDLGAAVAGWPMTMGSRAYAGFVPTHDDEVVKRLRRSGVVFVGKTNVPEFGTFPYTESELLGAAHNPWNLDHTPGGSSGGSAAAVAAGIVPMAHANDGGGSIRIPASCCGLFGLKPSRGRVPSGFRNADGPGALSIDGVVSRSVRDSVIMLDAISQVDPRWPKPIAPPPERPFAHELGQEPRRLRVAFVTDALLGDDVDPVCLEAQRQAANLLSELGHDVEEASPVFDRVATRSAFLTLFAALVATAIDGAELEIGRPTTRADFELDQRTLATIGNVLSASDLAHALGTQQRTIFALAGFMERYDVILSPTLAQPPARIGQLKASKRERLEMKLLGRLKSRKLLESKFDEIASKTMAYIGFPPLFNVTGQPAMSVPLHWSPEGLPIGVQFAGRYGDEATLVRLATQLEAARPWFTRRPPAYARPVAAP